jgi:hypothetical protein
MFFIYLDKNRTLDNVQKHDTCINVPLSQTFRSYVYLCVLNTHVDEWLLMKQELFKSIHFSLFLYET